jgi:hypothetical protein
MMSEMKIETCRQTARERKLRFRESTDNESDDNEDKTNAL